MSDKPMTGAEKYFAERMKDPEFAAAYEEAYKRIKLEFLASALEEGSNAKEV